MCQALKNVDREMSGPEWSLSQLAVGLVRFDGPIGIPHDEIPNAGGHEVNGELPLWKVSMPLEDPSPLHSLPLPSADAWTAGESEGCEGSRVGKGFLMRIPAQSEELWFQLKHQEYPENHLRLFADPITRHRKSNTCFGGRSALGHCSPYHVCRVA